MNRQFHNKRQSLTVIDKQTGMDRLFDWSKKIYWSHVQHKIKVKVIWNEFQSSTGLNTAAKKPDRGRTMPPPLEADMVKLVQAGFFVGLPW